MALGTGALKIVFVVAVIAVAGGMVASQTADVSIWPGITGTGNTDTGTVDITTTDVPSGETDDPTDVPTTPTYTHVDITGMTEITDVISITADGRYYIDGRTIASDSGAAIQVCPGVDVTIVIKGDCTITSDDSDAIRVASTSKLTIMGYDGDSALTVEAACTSGSGSGIGYKGSNTGDIAISGIGDLHAYGKGADAFGIGGVNSSVEITDSHISEAIGGSDHGNGRDYAAILDSYGKTGTGGPGIGGRNIAITGSVIDLAVGGPKGAGIGAIYHTATSVSIIDSTIGNAYGGTGSAGIGGSREMNGNDGTQTVTIYISNSDVTATGGDYGAGIGAGYDTYCQTNQGKCTITIVSHSKITAQGGKYAAGIGTGYHTANLAGSIDSTVDITNVHCGQQKNSYTEAQDIGYGVIQKVYWTENSGNVNREAVQIFNDGIGFTINDQAISMPTTLANFDMTH